MRSSFFFFFFLERNEGDKELKRKMQNANSVALGFVHGPPSSALVATKKQQIIQKLLISAIRRKEEHFRCVVAPLGTNQSDGRSMPLLRPSAYAKKGEEEFGVALGTLQVPLSFFFCT